MRNSDLLATGSTDGFVNIYKVQEEPGQIALMDKLPLPGSVNGVGFADEGRVLVCAQSVDQRLGRWTTRTSTPLGITVFRNIAKES